MSYDDPAGYEAYMGRWSVRLAPAFIDFAGLSDGQALLDVGCGTGVLTAALCHRFPNASVIGIDPSAAYVDHARRRRAARNVTYEVGDGMALAYPDDAFDACLSLLVLQAFPDRLRAVGEMRRVTRAGGTVAGAVWDFGEGMPLFSHLRNAVGQVAPDGAAGPVSRVPFALRREVGALWRDAGLIDITETHLQVTGEYRDFDDFWRTILGGGTPTTAYVAALGEAQRRQVAALMRSAILGSRPDGPFSLSARAWAVKGTVP